MKKIVLLTACISMVFAEETPSAFELQTQQEIENFLGTKEVVESTSAPTPSAEVATPKVQVEQPALPLTSSPNAVILTPKNVELNTETPILRGPLLQTSEDTATAAPTIIQQIVAEPEADIAAIEQEEKEVAAAVKSEGIVIDLSQVFSGSPTIYTLLFALSVGSISIWAYVLLYLRTPELIPTESLKEVREKLVGKQYDEALRVCEQNPSILFKMVAAGIQSRSLGSTLLADHMKAEGRRASASLWQKIALLNDIAVIAPMLGLLGTVLGMFYAFYDLNRSMESISALFDGLGISVGTTVGGLVVAILALLFHSISKYRLMRQLNLIENEAQALAVLIENKG